MINDLKRHSPLAPELVPELLLTLLAPLSVTALALTALMLATPAAQADVYQAAVNATERPPDDRIRDANSKPAEVLRFFGTPQRGVVIDLFAGGGYYSEILSRLLGSEGTIYLHNNQAYLGFAGDAVEQRLSGDRLTNVVRYDRELDAIDLEADSADMVLMVLTYHDLYYKTEGWDLDPEQFFATVHHVLKPGGVLAIVDHTAAPGSGKAPAQELHRIDPAFARQDIEGRGFVFEASSDVLHNPDDTLELNVFDPAIRGKTSKFVYKFVEPGA